MKIMALNTFCGNLVLGDKENANNCNECLKILRDIQIPFEDMFVECKFQNQVIDCKESFRETAISFALCHSFNGFQVYRWNIEANEHSDWNADDGYKSEASFDVYPRRAVGAGMKFGLSLLLRMKKTDLSYVCVGTPGFRVYKAEN
jgi:acid-sensing ion channel, other